MKHIKNGKELKKRRINKHKNANYSDLIYLIHILFIHKNIQILYLFHKTIKYSFSHFLISPISILILLLSSSQILP